MGMAEQNNRNICAIVGGVVGGLFVLVAIILFLWWMKKRRQKTQKTKLEEGDAQKPELRYSAAVTLVPSDYPGSPAKSMLLLLPIADGCAEFILTSSTRYDWQSTRSESAFILHHTTSG
jgi:H+/gluconate symporter-like permease